MEMLVVHVALFCSYGAPGVEFVGEHSDGLAVARLFFLPREGRIISLCENQTFHLWEVNFRDGKSFLDHVSQCETEDRLKNISACVLRSVPGADDEEVHSLLVGTESGNIYTLDCKTLQLSDYIIYQDTVIQK